MNRDRKPILAHPRLASRIAPIVTAVIIFAVTTWSVSWTCAYDTDLPTPSSVKLLRCAMNPLRVLVCLERGVSKPGIIMVFTSPDFILGTMC
jgi:hypothetical protein